MSTEHERPLSVAMMALGGQGGGVVTSWLVETAEANGYLAQSTYVAGVAQRTGATVYCVEMFSAGKVNGRSPVFTPYPIPGDVDLVIAGEMAETGRAIEKGFVTPNTSTLIASSHRVYSISEKEAMGDGIFDLSALSDIAEKASKRFICFDMQSAADESGSIISSVILGAIAASGALPFERNAFEETIRRTGKAVESNLKGFAAGFDGANVERPNAAAEVVEKPSPEGPNGKALARQIEAEFPEAVRDMALHGALRALDYQDRRYSNQYVELLKRIVAVDHKSASYALSVEVARQLALQMCYEDTIRVADLKTRSDRFRRIRQHVAAESDQPVHVIEYFHPRIEEVCDTLPRGIGERVLNSSSFRKLLSPFFSQGRNVKTTGIFGFMLLHLTSKLQRFRRHTYRFEKQRQFIDGWLERVVAATKVDYDFAVSIARCVEMVKGYGETYERGRNRYLATVAAGNTADAINRLHRAALADEKGIAFEDALTAFEADR